MNIAAIIQARMGSVRLPGKVLMDLCGKPVLWHVVDRLRGSSLITRPIIATTINKKDDVIIEFCKHNKVDYYRGSESDVLERYYLTAKKFKVDIVIRITSDCPLIDPQVVDQAISVYLSRKGDSDGASNTLKRTYPRGLDTEVFSFKALERCWKLADQDYQREHVTAYMYENAALFNLVSVENDKDLSSWRWTIDEIDDYEFVKKVFENLFFEKRDFSMKDIEILLQKNRSLLEINKNVQQKATR